MKESDCYVGKKVGRLTLIGRHREHFKSYGNRWVWHCVCTCGNEVDVPTFRFCDKRSCGCLARESSTKNGKLNKKNTSDLADSNPRSPYRRLYIKWHDMIVRCENPKKINYKNYGKRGISVCKYWHDYYKFKAWAINAGYNCKDSNRDEQTIDRIDVNGNYEPSNCRLVSTTVQNRNKRNNILFLYHGNRLTFEELAKELGIDLTYMRNQYYHNEASKETFVDFILKKEKHKGDRVK